MENSKLKAARDDWQQLKTNKKAMRDKRKNGRGRAWLLEA